LGITNVFQNHFQISVFVAGSYLANWESRPEYAHTLLEQSIALNSDITPFPAMLALQDSLDRPSRPIDQLWDPVDDLLDRGYLLYAAHLAVVIAELGWDPAAKAGRCDPDRAERLVRLGSAAQSRLVRAWTGYVQAVVTKDVARLGHIVAELHDASGPTTATRARITLALMLRERGDLAGWLEQAGEAWSESRYMTHDCDGMFSRLVAAVDLTEREADVARLVIQNYSTREIADELCVVPRTVEAHLYSVYRKTGVSSRDDLGRIARTWFNLSTDFQEF